MATLNSTIPKTQLLLSNFSNTSGVTLAKLHRIPQKTPLANRRHLHRRHCSAAASIFKEVQVGVRSPELVAAEYAELNLPLSNPQEMGLIRTRQHVNPLSASFTEPAQVPDWNKVFKDPKLPLMVDIGSGIIAARNILLGNKARYSNPSGKNSKVEKVVADFYCGLLKEIPIPIIIWDLKYVRSHFLFANATISFKELVSTYPGPLVLVSILCPDPHFKKRHHKRRVLQKPLAESIIDSLLPGGQVFIQSDVLQVAVDMRNQFDTHSDKLVAIDNLQECDKEGWLLGNPMGIRTEREIHAESEGAEIYRRLYQKRI